MVGADADVYMGVVTNTIATPTVSIRAIPDSTFIHMTGELLAGRMVEIAMGYGEKGDTFHLVRDETVSFTQELKSNFVHSQKYITSQLRRQCQTSVQGLSPPASAARFVVSYLPTPLSAACSYTLRLSLSCCPLC